MGSSQMRSETNDPVRRLRPRIIDSDWLVMRGMARAIAAIASKSAGKGEVVIDFGCGSMPYRPLFLEAGGRYLGADFDGAPDIRIDTAGRMGVADGSADTVVSFQVLEHVRDLDRYFAEIRRVLKPAGRLVLSTHGVWLYHPHPEDHRRWTREGLVAELEGHGFKVLACAPIVGPLAWTTILRLTGFCYVLKQIPVVGGALSCFLSAVMNARAAIEDRLTPSSIIADNACVYVTVSEVVPDGCDV